MQIDVYCNDGSPLKVIPSDIYEGGVGGAELSLMTWAEYTAKRGHKVSIYNNPKVAGSYGGVEYLPQREFSDDSNRDALIVWRSPFQRLRTLTGDYLKIHWSTDQMTIGNYTRDILPFVDGVVTISPFHLAHYKKAYNPRHAFPDDHIAYLDLGVRAVDYQNAGEINKKRYTMIWASVPDRGLDLLLKVWGEIKERVPQAHLSITGDYTLWGGRAYGMQMYKPRWGGYASSVDYLGAVPRADLVKLQMESDIALGSFTYDELFCISSAEAQYAGAVSVTGDRGALPTTNKSGVVIPMAKLIKTLPDRIANLYADGGIDKTQELAHGYAKRRFDWDYICQKWEYLLSTGDFSE